MSSSCTHKVPTQFLYRDTCPVCLAVNSTKKFSPLALACLMYARQPLLDPRNFEEVILIHVDRVDIRLYPWDESTIYRRINEFLS